MRPLFAATALLALFFCEEPEHEPVRIGDIAAHSAFTDLVEFKGLTYCAFREGEGHASGAEGKVRVLAQAEDSSWSSVALLELANVDLRDPKLSVMPDGRMMMLCGGSYYTDGVLQKMRTQVSFYNATSNTFSAPRPVIIDEEVRSERDWLWRVTWHKEVGYGVVYQSQGSETVIHLLSTTDGVHYSNITRLPVEGSPNETTLRFAEDGRMVALVRREGDDHLAHIGVAKAPFQEWSFNPLPEAMGGPELTLLPDGQWLAAYRRYRPDGQRTALALIGLDGALKEVYVAKSGGDTSYPGLLTRGEKLLMSYYSSHEEKTCVYLLTLDIPELLSLR